ncbi:MAG: response regulator [Verrucomicrobiota bacterium]
MATEGDRGVLTGDELPSGVGFSLRGWAAGIGVVLVLAFAAVGVLQARQAALLRGTVFYKGDYLVWSFFQMELELSRLRSAARDWLHQPDGEDWEAVQTRYEIFVSRVDLIDPTRTVAAIPTTAQYSNTVDRLREWVRQADPVLAPGEGRPPEAAAVQALLPALEALETPVRELSMEASHAVGRRQTDQNAVVQRQNRLGTGLTVFQCALTLVFAGLALRHVRLLETRQQRLEELAQRLRQARVEAESANRAKTEFLANISHELRTPFQGILGMLDLLGDFPSDSPQRKYLGTARDSARHLLTLLNDILDLSKLETGRFEVHPEAAELATVVGDVEAAMRAPAIHKGLGWRVRLAPDLPPGVQLDATRVRQVLFNLVGNAIKFSHQGEVRLDVLRRTGREGGPELVFRVMDEGIGIDEATAARLFQRFTQGDSSPVRRFEGTGLGLEISRRLARLMGGDVTFISRPGVGSTFELSLPLVPLVPPLARPESVRPPAGLTSTGVAPRRILVAEDNPVNRQFLQAVLDQQGHEVTFAFHGKEALEACRQQTFDVVLMDLHMPEMDGLDACRAIRALPGPAGGVPIVALTADGFPETRERARAAGMNDFLTKPVSGRELAATLGRFPRAGGPPSNAAPAPPARPPAADGGEGPLLNEATLAEVRAVLSAEAFRQALLQVCDPQAGSGPILRQAMARGDLPVVRREAHALKGAALTLGLSGLGRAAAALQRTAGEGDPAGAGRAWEHLQEQILRTRELVENLLPSDSAPPAA